MCTISIIVPVYNGASNIAIAINSVLEQDYQNWELLIVNDGSTDNTEKIINEFKDPRIVYFYQENKGVSAARNVGLSFAKGTYLCFLDSDDAFPAGSLSVRLAMLQNNENIGFVDGGVRITDQYSDVKHGNWIPQKRGKNPFQELIRLNGKCFFSPTWMIRRSLINDLRFDTRLTHGEDLFFFMELTYHNPEFIYDFVDEEILTYRKNNSSAMANLNGLEDGYYHMSRMIGEKFDIKLSNIVYFKMLASKIMFLSFLAQGQLIKGIRSLLRIMFL